ncbi:flagellar biosynthesis protein FlhB [Stenotrophomonas maltophilia]|uniref:flagellar biosynthesis protein FlhB n=1 Tax=Stenotrophomonas maltophilia TaxID=40324 RepID=UPI000B4DD6A1|nr:flagellar biosynthesis protein FlhB [Stenotrophomonas maltophilia]OWQ67448.1 flagellar biosynthesis protein FlhB [Stenotrophomonas maltophilia]QGL67719.1 flagellar biosynthesis protein FlhB [Stenotrophomonas maltophilia]
MSENESAGEKTEQPTEKRLRDAREQGNLPRSRELGTAAVFGAGVLAVMAMSGSIGRGASAWMKHALSPEQGLRQNPKELFGHFGDLLLQFMLVIAPLVLVCLLASFVAPLVMGGLRWSQKALLPDINRMNPMSGLKRLYGPEAIAEFTKSLLRVALVGVAAGLVVWTGFDTLRGLIHHPLETAITDGLGFTLRLLLATAGAMLVLAAIDAPYQRWNWMRKLKMTREELRREMKESEGSPEVKGRIRQLQQQMANRRMMEAVPTADVVVVNPTHYAVALKYEGGTMNAPTVVALGVDETALRIREVADGNKVAIVSAPPLARALYREGQLGKEIPVRLYSAVAQVLSYVYQLRAWRTGPMPDAPHIQVDEFGKGGRP